MKFKNECCENKGLYIPGAAVRLINADSLLIGNNDCCFITEDVVFTKEIS